MSPVRSRTFVARRPRSRTIIKFAVAIRRWARDVWVGDGTRPVCTAEDGSGHPASTPLAISEIRLSSTRVELTAISENEHVSSQHVTEATRPRTRWTTKRMGPNRSPDRKPVGRQPRPTLSHSDPRAAQPPTGPLERGGFQPIGLPRQRGSPVRRAERWGTQPPTVTT